MTGALRPVRDGARTLDRSAASRPRVSKNRADGRRPSIARSKARRVRSPGLGRDVRAGMTGGVGTKEQQGDRGDHRIAVTDPEPGNAVVETRGKGAALIAHTRMGQLPQMLVLVMTRDVAGSVATTVRRRREATRRGLGPRRVE